MDSNYRKPEVRLIPFPIKNKEKYRKEIGESV
jgi:hypothetical protein